MGEEQASFFSVLTYLSFPTVVVLGANMLMYFSVQAISYKEAPKGA